MHAEVLFLCLAAGVALVVKPETSFARVYPVIALTAVAMGLRNAVVRKLAVPDLTTTVLTLTVTGLAAESVLAGGVAPRSGRRMLSILAIGSGRWSARCWCDRSGCGFHQRTVDETRSCPLSQHDRAFSFQTDVLS
jgi:hypothetical protein